MDKKNGFTLIELIVTMALMLSILGIAIVSLIGISSAKKKEAWQQIKQQVETAAVEYFTANEYLFEDMSDNVDAYISVGKLVEETNMVGSTSCDNSVCNSYGTEIVTRTYQKYYKDKNSGAFCGNIGDPWYENDYYPNSSHCNYKSCTQPAVTTTTTKTTTTAKKKPTKSCDWSKVKISFSVSNANKDHCYAVGESVTKEKDATSFKVKFSYPSDFEKKDTHAAFCNDKNTCKSVKESNPGQTSVVCTNSTKCYENYKYVGASIELKCGKTTRTIYGSASIKDVKK